MASYYWGRGYKADLHTLLAINIYSIIMEYTNSGDLYQKI